MAYAYPSLGSGNPSSSSVSLAHSSPGKTHHSAGQSRKTSDDKFDIIREFKVKIEEDENYLAFFQDRIRVEEEYIAGLRRCYSRSKAVDTLHDDAFRREEKSTTRRAWDEVRDYTNREIQAREAMTGALKEVVVKELVRLKDEQERIRLGLKENMKHANEMYDEHAKVQLPRLKRNYFTKCQALEDHKRQEHAIAMQAKLLADSPTSPQAQPTVLREHPNAYTLSGKEGYPLSPPTATQALPPASNPSMPFEATGQEKKHGHSHSISHGRLRAGSGSGQGSQQAKDVLNDLAAQGKKGFNAIMQKLGGDKSEKDDSGVGGFVPPPKEEHEGVQRRVTSSRGDPARGMGTMKGVRVKREADEADKAYRLGVFHLESLRLRRDKLQTSAARNLEAFNDDLNKTLISTLEVYIDTMHGTAATTAQATEVARQAIQQVNLDKDTSLFRSRLRAVDVQRTLPVPYHNFYVGECRSLIFGVSLTDYDFARGEGTDKGRPPTIVEKCISAIDEKGLDAEGIYRISGRHAGVQKMIQDIELDEEKFNFEDKDDVFSISNVLKQYLRELPEAIFPMSQAERVKYTENRETHIHSNFSALRARLRRMAPIHQTTFQAIVEHLSRVAANSSQNKMDAKNLAVVFNSVLFGQEQIGNEASLLNMGVEKDTLLEDLISYSDLLFGAEDIPAAPGVLPPGAALSRSGVKSYHPVADGFHPGSSRTKFKLLNPADQDALPGSSSSASLSGLAQPADHALEAPTHELDADMAAETATAPVDALTPDDELDLLFDPEAIPQGMRDALGPDLHVRPLSSTDLMRSHFGLLQTLTVAPPIAPSLYSALFTHLKACPETYFITVVVDKKTDQLVAHGTVMVEQKYIHGGSSAAHIEDIVVSPDCRGGGVGKKMVLGLRDLALGRGCYKVVLHCKEEKIPFYEKCGFEARSKGMAYYRSVKDLTPNPTGGVFGIVPPPQHAMGNKLTVDTGMPISVDLASEASPRSESSGSGITYSFPVPPNLALSPAFQAQPLNRPTTSRQSSDVTAPGRVDLEANEGEQPTALEEVPDAPEVPAWAAEGLGSSEKPAQSPGLLSPEDLTRVGGELDGEGGTAKRPVTPLPPGAAPPNLEQEPERIVTPRG